MFSFFNNKSHLLTLCFCMLAIILGSASSNSQEPEDFQTQDNKVIESGGHFRRITPIKTLDTYKCSDWEMRIEWGYKPEISARQAISVVGPWDVNRNKTITDAINSSLKSANASAFLSSAICWPDALSFTPNTEEKKYNFTISKSGLIIPNNDD